MHSPCVPLADIFSDLFSTLRSQLQLVGTLGAGQANVFRVSANDLIAMTDITLSLPAYSPGANVTVIINVMYDDEPTGAFAQPNVTARVPATAIRLDHFGVAGLFNDPYVVSRIIWNFPYATAINMSFVGFRGSILAPNAGVWVCD